MSNQEGQSAKSPSGASGTANGGVREIRLPQIDWSEIQGVAAVIPVKVDWPELRLTEEQMLVNSMALCVGWEAPYPDRSFIDVIVPLPIVEMERRINDAEGQRPGPSGTSTDAPNDGP